MKKSFMYVVLLLLIVASGFFVIRNLSFKKINKAEENTLPVLEEKKIAQKFDNGYFAPILTFHNVVDGPIKDKYGLTISKVELENHIKTLKDNSYKTIFITELGKYLENGEKIPKNEVALTFDDGKENFYVNVFPLLKKYNIKASLYIITGVRSKHYMNDDQIKEVFKSGLVEIGSHTVYHQYLAKMSDADQLKELKNSKKYLDDLLGQDTSVICYPYGSHNEKTKEYAKQVGYKYGLNFNQIPLEDSNDMFEIDRVGIPPGINLVKYLEKLNIKNKNI